MSFKTQNNAGVYTADYTLQNMHIAKLFVKCQAMVETRNGNF